MLHVTILTIFPEMFPGVLGYSLAGKALAQNIWSYDLINIRDFGLTKHKNIDDKPYGGGPGLLMRPDVLGSAMDYALNNQPNATIYYPSPKGQLFNQTISHSISVKKEIIILCGRFEGVDERVIDEYNIEQISIGDYVLSGGELAAMVMLDAVIRLLPGTLKNANTINSESFEKNGEFSGLLECPSYTKPEIWRGKRVPEVLMSGNHDAISKWRKNQSMTLTKKLRPDLYN